MPMSYWRFLVCVLLATAFSAPAFADPGDAIGAAVSIVNHVTGEYDRNLRNLETGDDVRQEEIIAVADDSLGELMLRDQTKVALGPGARLTLDRFIYDPNRTTGSIVLNLVKGGFRFITGIAAKPSTRSARPSPRSRCAARCSTSTSRGTRPSGSCCTKARSPSATTAANVASSTIPAMSCVSAPAANARSRYLERAAIPRDVSFDTAFPFVVKPPGIDPKPIFSREDIELGRCPSRRCARSTTSPTRSRRSRGAIRRADRGSHMRGATGGIRGTIPVCRTSP